MAKKDKGKSKVTVYPGWCKGCGVCVEFCPGKVLELNEDGKSTVVREDDCIRCGFCELHCPDFAIVVTDKDPDTGNNNNNASKKKA
ncbi:4Fe-4S dicluster domain-containing protein [Pseudodesulfovibrio tunisiensis]|uniref:4Fe-4S dicluster domain-containing protein n=1 Tax=Pseudodesulfovibrio tunisiensis TaxID=463192 RepID=UPI001FB56845|nr:4Fe-4S binding protein [Pseudodesulfovibrio tunisiensis]